MATQSISWGNRYVAWVTRLIDGDTVVADIDLGFHVILKDIHLRLDGYNAPELHGPQREAGIAAQNYLGSLLDKCNNKMYIETGVVVVQSFERYVAFAYLLIDNVFHTLEGLMRQGGYHVSRAPTAALVPSDLAENMIGLAIDANGSYLD